MGRNHDNNNGLELRLYIGAAAILFGLLSSCILIIYNLAVERVGQAEREIHSIQVERLPQAERRISVNETRISSLEQILNSVRK